jgi:chemotaxis-related protein WspB
MLVVTFTVSNARYAIPCQRIIVVMPLVAVRAVPQAPASVLGSFVHRGILTPVLDVCQLMGGYACPMQLSSRIIVTECRLPQQKSIKVGLLAADVTEARHLNAAPLAGMSAGAAHYLGDIIKDGDSLFQIVHTEGLLLGSGAAVAEFFADGRLTASEAGRAITES